MKDKTLFISSFHPLISRNILQTKVLELLSLDPQLRVVILCPAYKKEYFNKMFDGSRNTIIGIEIVSSSRVERFWKELGNALLRTSTIQGNRRERFLIDHKYFGYAMFLFVNNVFARIRQFVKLYQFFTPYFFNFSVYEKLIRKFKPTAVFSTDMFNDEDVKFLIAAKKCQVKSFGMVRSWDNCTNKGILPVTPDFAISNNKIIANELEKFHRISSKDVTVVGIPQFDYYKDYKPKDLEVFFKRTGFSRNRKIILFAPTGLKFVDDDWFLLQTLIEAIRDEKIKGRPQVLVRFPPGDRMDMGKVSLNCGVDIFIDRPGVSFNDSILKDREISRDDMTWLADSLYWSSILVSVGSTLCIDITVFNKPIITPSILVPGVRFERSMRKMYNKFHYNYLLRTGGCLYPQSVEEYIDAVNRSLNKSSLMEKGRKLLLTEQVVFTDGMSGKRLADFILTKIKI